MKVGIAGSMGNRGTYAHSVHRQGAAPAERHVQQEDNTSSPSWRNYSNCMERQVGVKSSKCSLPDSLAMQCWQEVRAARVEALRAQVQAGTYQVDSMAIAKWLLGYAQAGCLSNEVIHE